MAEMKAATGASRVARSPRVQVSRSIGFRSVSTADSKDRILAACVRFAGHAGSVCSNGRMYATTTVYCTHPHVKYVSLRGFRRDLWATGSVCHPPTLSLNSLNPPSVHICTYG